MVFPPLPRVIQGMSGPITILRPVRLTKELGAHGSWEYLSRRIRVQGTLERRMAWETLIHEMAHAALWDNGFPIDGELEERLCDLWASSMTHLVEHLVTERE